MEVDILGIIEKISSKYETQLPFDQLKSFISERLIPSYCNQQIDNYKCWFSKYKVRVNEKYKLNKLVNRDPKILIDDQWINMYYQADKHRLSAFFLIEFFDRTDVFRRIDKHINS